MEQHDTDEKPLMIPRNCAPMEYVIDGFMATDFAYTVFVSFIGGLMAIISYIETEDAIRSMFIFAMFIAVAVLIFRRDMYTENLIDKIRILVKYKQMPKKYRYEYVNIYENVKE